jgi:bacteriocin biosynthesis cyclodehydratase domain-containing protein
MSGAPPMAENTVALAGAGDFGQRVIQLISASHPESVIFPEAAIEHAFAARPRLVVLALWRPSMSLCERADELAFQHRVPWLAITLEHFAIRVGPLVRPPAAPCYRCYRRRRRQHESQYQATIALHQAYEADPRCGPGGYLPHQARLVAGVALAAISEIIDGPPDQAAGRPAHVLTVQALAADITVSEVIACHACPRCGHPEDRQGNPGRILDALSLAAAG